MSGGLKSGRMFTFHGTPAFSPSPGRVSPAAADAEAADFSAQVEVLGRVGLGAPLAVCSEPESGEMRIAQQPNALQPASRGAPSLLPPLHTPARLSRIAATAIPLPMCPPAPRHQRCDPPRARPHSIPPPIPNPSPRPSGSPLTCWAPPRATCTRHHRCLRTHNTVGQAGRAPRTMIQEGAWWTADGLTELVGGHVLAAGGEVHDAVGRGDRIDHHVHAKHGAGAA